jgi:hypothetical protein
VTVYLDNFQVQSAVAPTPTPTPTPIVGAATSPDIAVSSLSNAGASFTASFAPYSVNVISLTKPSLAPAFVSQPSSQTIASGGTVVFSAPATGTPLPTYQWYLNGTAIASATNPTLLVSGATAADAGSYTCTISNPSGTLKSSAAVLGVVNASSPGRLINIATRAQVETGGNILIPGFVIGGSGTETLLIRADGPALTAFGVSGALAAPSLVLTNQSTGATLATNTGWGTNTNPTPAQIASVAAQVGAFALANGSADCAAIVTLQPGAYTVQVSGVGGTTGVALAEVYEVSYTGTARLVNIATRAQVGTGGQHPYPRLCDWWLHGGDGPHPRRRAEPDGVRGLGRACRAEPDPDRAVYGSHPRCEHQLGHQSEPRTDRQRRGSGGRLRRVERERGQRGARDASAGSLHGADIGRGQHDRRRACRDIRGEVGGPAGGGGAGRGQPQLSLGPGRGAYVD